jgi:regulatory protein YycH of two-component signal transduction system YycFG
MKKKTKPNKKVVLLSLLALICLALTYFIHWLFILPIAVILWINQRELFKK